MRNMAFSLTTPQMRERTKDITRRIGWEFLKPGDRVCAIVKGMGLKKGEKIERLYVIEIISNRAEPLSRMVTDPEYGASEVRREGFPHLTPLQFVDRFTKRARIERTKPIQRIEFKEVMNPFNSMASIP